MAELSNYIIPCLFAFVVLYGLFHKVDVFDCFMAGAKEGMQVGVRILPALIALVVAVGMFKTSGALDVFTHALSPVFDQLGIPSAIIPQAMLRPISGSGALVMFEDILKTHGADSFIGRVASVIQGSTETTFYTIAVYYGATHIQKTRHTVGAAAVGDLVGFTASVVAVKLLFGY